MSKGSAIDWQNVHQTGVQAVSTCGSSIAAMLCHGHGLTGNLHYLEGFHCLLHPAQPRVQVEVALQWANTNTDSQISFVNCIRTIDGGAHLDGTKQAITRVVNKLAKEKGLLKDGAASIAGDFVREGLTMVCCQMFIVL